MMSALRDRLLALITADFPELEVRSSHLATNGWDNDVVIVNDEYVFRFATEPHTPLDVEMAALNRLRGKQHLRFPTSSSSDGRRRIWVIG